MSDACNYCPDDSCRARIVEIARRVGLDVVAYTNPPDNPSPSIRELIAGGLPQCSHGTMWYIEPTDQFRVRLTAGERQ